VTRFGRTGPASALVPGHGTGINGCGQLAGCEGRGHGDRLGRKPAPARARHLRPGRWEGLIEQVLSVPPAYRATPGRPVYVIRAGDRAVVVGEENLVGSLQDLVTTILYTGDLA
jgi:hypothetical protein